MTPSELAELERYLSPRERAELHALIEQDLAEVIWRPLPGPQSNAYSSQADVTGYGGAAGGGKGLCLSTPVPTPTGWTTMGAVQVGDVLFDNEGSPCHVTAVSEVAHRACFRLTFDDGTQVVADDVHRWVTFTAKELAALTRHDPEWRARRRAQRPSRAKDTTSPARLAALTERNARCAVGSPLPEGEMRDTAEIARTLTAGTRRNHAVRVAGAINLPSAELPVPPYTLGAWLGDGTSRNGQLTGEDAYVWERIESEGFEVRHYAWNDQAHSIIGLKVKLNALGVLTNKHIPDTYLRASYDQRLALLQGLMDTDGHAALDGGCEFDNMNETLARGVRQLVSSLGIKSTMQKGTARLDGRAVGLKWRVKFTTSVPVFGMPRKAERLKAQTRRTAGFRYVVSCEPIPSVPTRCIAVDSPSHQFLVGETFLPTHNTDLAAGLVLTKHKRCLFVRREKAQTEGVVQRLGEVLGGTDGYNSQKGAWVIAPGKLCEFAGLDNPGDERRWQGRPHDLKVFDEVTEMREGQVRFVMGWNRTNDPSVKPRVLFCFNPPTTSEGRWVIDFFGPWLDKKHPLYPTPPGTLRWCAMLPDGRGNSTDRWVVDGRPFVLVDGTPSYDFDADTHAPEDIITPKSRTFIPARLTDNPIYLATGYMSTLQSLPEPLRSQMLYGDFQAGISDDPWVVIPTAWVEAAQARWKPREPRGEMLATGVDVARGGKDSTVIANRHRDDQAGHSLWFDHPKVYPGTETPNGQKVAGLVVSEIKDGSPILLDVIGVGASPYDILNGMGVQVIGVNVSEKADSTDKSGKLKFFNLRSQLWWKMREALDPANDTGIALPPDPQLLRELCTPKWTVSGFTVKVESRDDIISRLGKSPDLATAYVQALIDVPKIKALQIAAARDQTINYDPMAHMRNPHQAAEYDPFR